jgi:PAS domain S-box-containing protein
VNVSQPLVQASLVGEAIDRGPALVLVADDEMSYLAVNQFACDVLGYSREELLGMKVTDVVPGPDGARAFATLIETSTAAGRARLLCKDGTEVDFDFRATRTTVAGLELYVSIGFVPA